MIWAVIVVASALILGIFLWLSLGKPSDLVYDDPRKFHWSVLDDVDPGWVAMQRKARERYWRENP